MARLMLMAEHRLSTRTGSSVLGMIAFVLCVAVDYRPDSLPGMAGNSMCDRTSVDNSDSGICRQQDQRIPYLSKSLEIRFYWVFRLPTLPGSHAVSMKNDYLASHPAARESSPNTARSAGYLT